MRLSVTRDEGRVVVLIVEAEVVVDKPGVEPVVVLEVTEAVLTAVLPELLGGIAEFSSAK